MRAHLPIYFHVGKSWRARARIFAGFGLALALIAVTLGVAYTSLRTIKKTSQRITGDVIPSIYLGGKLQNALLFRHTLLIDHVEAGGEREKSDLDGQIESTNAEIENVLKKYEELIDSPMDRRIFSGLKAGRRAAYGRCYLRVLQLSHERRREEALHVIRTDLIPLRDALFQTAEAEFFWNKADADDAAKAITAAVNWTWTGILAFVAFSVTIAGMAHDVRKRLRAEQQLRRSVTSVSGRFSNTRPSVSASPRSIGGSRRRMRRVAGRWDIPKANCWASPGRR